MGITPFVIGAAVSTGMGAYEASQAAGIAGQAESESGTVFGEQQYYAQQLQQLIANPSSVTSLPGYGFQLQQGQNALVSQAAAQGYLGSGNLGTALVKYGQNYAQSAYGQQEQILAQLSGLTAPSSPTQYLGAATAAQQSAAQQWSNLTNSMMFMGMMGSGGFGANPWGSGGSIPYQGITDTAGSGYVP